MCMMIGAMKTLQITLAVILGIIALVFYFILYHPNGQFYFGGFIGGTLAYFHRRIKCQIAYFLVILITSSCNISLQDF